MVSISLLGLLSSLENNLKAETMTLPHLCFHTSANHSIPYLFSHLAKRYCVYQRYCICHLRPQFYSLALNLNILSMNRYFNDSVPLAPSPHELSYLLYCVQTFI